MDTEIFIVTKGQTFSYIMGSDERMDVVYNNTSLV